MTFLNNHQEDDFSIDGYLDVIREDGAVLGRSLAVQVKTGLSHIVKATTFGSVLKGTRKHLNYFLNYPTPVLLIHVDEAAQSARWVSVCPEAIRMRKTDWEITVPHGQRLDAASVSSLNALAGKTTDYLPLLDQMAAVRAAVSDAAAIVILEINCFLTRHFASLNTLTEKYGISEAINEEISRAIGGLLFRLAGLVPPT